MLYYKVTQPDKLFCFNGYMQTVANELFTPAEFRKLNKPDKHGCRLREEWVRPVFVSRKRTYWMFGARFSY